MDESHKAREIAKHLGTDHTEYFFDETDALKMTKRMSSFFDEPHGDSSILPTLLVSELASQKVKVVLSGDGGDELFAGYEKYLKLLKVSGIPGWQRRLMSQLLSLGAGKALFVLNQILPQERKGSR